MSIPPRWLNCPRKGQVIAGKFLPFKTPLSSQYDEEVPEENRFGVPMLVMYVEALQVRMGLVIDLTKTSRYYDKRDLIQEHNIGHYKLQCEGFGETPTSEQVDEFKRVCSHFFQQHPGEIIGVHCTHGYNRTGFLIISYLIEVEDWGFEVALASFVKARHPGIYKPEYLEGLATRYANGESVSAPPRPAWCMEEEEPGVKLGKRKRPEQQNESARFMEGVGGVCFVGPPLREDIQQQCQYILKWEQSGFPGSQPVSMDVQNIRLLHDKPYRVSWKADGTRYMMYIRDRDSVFMIDRDNAVFQVPQLKFPSRTRLGDYLRDTLLDGEMVLDKDHGSVRPRFLIYDIMQFEKNSEVALCDHRVRMSCISKEVVDPREAAARDGKLDKSLEPFSVRAKMFWDVSTETMLMLEKFVKKITHENDGFIFSPGTDPYVAGRCDAILKWKPADLNSVDFRLSIVEKNQPGELRTKVGQLFVGGFKEPFSQIDLKVNKEAKNYNGRIIECTWNPDSGWHFLRVRDDKSFPNSLTTARSVVQSIKQPVTRDWLLHVIKVIPDHLKPKKDSELMPPPRHKPRPPSTSS